MSDIFEQLPDGYHLEHFHGRWYVNYEDDVGHLCRIQREDRHEDRYWMSSPRAVQAAWEHAKQQQEGKEGTTP